MSNDLIGDLSKTRLFDLVTPLLNRKKSGLIQIKGHKVGELYIEGGNIIHAKTDDSSGEEAILSIMEWDTGRVTFNWEATTDEQTVFMPTEQLLVIWTNREMEWSRIREVIPSLDLVFQMPINSSPEDRNIQAIHWRILALCNGSRTVADIATALKWHPFETAQAMYQMCQSGLLERGDEKKAEGKTPAMNKTVNGNFFPVIENELSKIMGPMAPIIIDDIISDFGESRDAFPVDRLPPFVQAVGEEITDKTKRALFAKIMTDFLAQKQK